MPWLGGSNKVLVVDIKGFKKWQPGVVNQLVCPGLGRRVIGASGSKNLLAVLVGPGQQESITSLLALPAS